MLKRFLILASAGWLLSGCASSTMPSVPPVSEAALQSCPPLRQLPSGSHQDVERWAVDTALRYRECSDRQAMAAGVLRSQGNWETK